MWHVESSSWSTMANNSAEGPGIRNAILRHGSQLMENSVNLYRSYLLTRNLDDIHQAVRSARESVDLISPFGVPIEPQLQLARTLLRRFQDTRQDEDVTEAIRMFRNVLQMLPDDDPLYQKFLDYLSISYFERDGNFDGLLELNAPFAYNQSRLSLETLTQILGEDEEVYEYCDRTALDLQIRYSAKNRMEDLNSLIQLLRHARDFFSSKLEVSVNFDRCGRMMIVLAYFLTWRFERRHELEDINEAADCCSVGVALMLPDGTSWRPQSMASFVYLRRFGALERQTDLDNAVHFAKLAVEVIEVHYPNHAQKPGFATCWNSLGLAMLHRYHTTGDASDLDAATDASSRAVDIAEGDAQLPRWLNNLSLTLKYRYQRSGRAEDLMEAIATTQRAVNCLPPNDPKLISILSNLSGYELTLFDVLQDVECIIRAHQHLQIAWSIRNEDPDLRHEVHVDLMNSTALILLIFSERPGVDLTREKFGWAIDEAIDMARTSASIRHHPLAVYSHHFLCVCLVSRWESAHAIQDINEAISTARGMIKLADASTEVSVLARYNLGRCLYCRYKSTGVDHDREEALAVLREGFQTSAGTPFRRIEAGQLAINILQKKADWDSACKVSRQIIALFAMLNGRSQGWLQKQGWLQLLSHHTAGYASIAIEAGRNVLAVIDLLEVCRGSILGHLIDKQSDLHDLTEAAPEKAEQFRTLRDEVNVESDLSTSANTRVKQTTRRIKAEGEILACLEDIRRLEGFHRFLLGPTQEELKVAAGRGPILIVNFSELRSDVLIITKDALVLLPLPELKREKLDEYFCKDLTNFSFLDVGRKNKKFRELQEWLWDNCVKLIFEKLKDLGYGPAKFHLWWIGVGIANFLPFHAAGKYVGDLSETALSRAISSYAPTLKVLIHGQRKLQNDPQKMDIQRLTLKQQAHEVKPRLAVISMPTTPGHEPLDGVKQEAEEIQKIVAGTFATQILVQPSVEDTMAHMGDCDIVHFACHGESTVPDPSRSHLLLQTTTPDSTVPTIDKLNLRDVAATELSHGKLAFLSACSTAQNKVLALGDEVLHLVSGFQVAGFLNVIGNLWPSSDDVSVELVEGFYKHLVAAGEFGSGEHVAAALNEALLDIAKKYAKQPLYWAQFVHFGI